jgi:hypothetical protein
MRKYLTTSILVLGLASPALAAAEAGNQHFAVKDTVGNCAVVDTLPSESSEMSKAMAAWPMPRRALGSDCISKIDRA